MLCLLAPRRGDISKRQGGGPPLVKKPPRARTRACSKQKRGWQANHPGKSCSNAQPQAESQHCQFEATRLWSRLFHTNSLPGGRQPRLNIRTRAYRPLGGNDLKAGSGQLASRHLLQPPRAATTRASTSQAKPAKTRDRPSPAYCTHMQPMWEHSPEPHQRKNRKTMRIMNTINQGRPAATLVEPTGAAPGAAH